MVTIEALCSIAQYRNGTFVPVHAGEQTEWDRADAEKMARAGVCKIVTPDKRK